MRGTNGGLGKVAIAVSGAVLLASVSTTSASAESGTMTQARAGRVYLRDVCATYPAAYRLYRALPMHNGSWRTKDLTPPVFRRVKLAAGNLSNVDFTFARRLYNPPLPWPTNVATPVNRMAGVVTRESRVLHDLSRALTPRGFARIWDNRYQPLWKPADNLSAIIRARLNLPGKGC